MRFEPAGRLPHRLAALRRLTVTRSATEPVHPYWTEQIGTYADIRIGRLQVHSAQKHWDNPDRHCWDWPVRPVLACRAGCGRAASGLCGEGGRVGALLMFGCPGLWWGLEQSPCRWTMVVRTGWSRWCSALSCRRRRPAVRPCLPSGGEPGSRRRRSATGSPRPRRRRTRPPESEAARRSGRGLRSHADSHRASHRSANSSFKRTSLQKSKRSRRSTGPSIRASAVRPPTSRAACHRWRCRDCAVSLRR